MKKRKLQTWKTMGKKIKVSSNGQILELQEDRNLFAHMMVICKSRPEIDIQEAVGTYEFTVVPRSMFATDGEMLHCPAKSVLMSILEKLPAKTDDCKSRCYESGGKNASLYHWCNGWSAILRQARLDKELLTTCRSLRMPHLWEVWRQWQITPHLWSLRSPVLPERSYSQEETRKPWSSLLPCNVHHTYRQGPNEEAAFPCENKEWADRVLGRKDHRARRAKWNTCSGSLRLWKQGKQERHVIFEEWPRGSRHQDCPACPGCYSQWSNWNQNSFPDTDVFILCLRRYPDLCQNTVFVTGKGQNYREINLQPIIRALGPLKTAALPA